MPLPTPSVSALQVLSLVASALPKVNPPVPIYAILASDTFVPLAVPSSWGEFSPKYDVQMSDYPQEQGAFQPYNKVRRPQVVTVTMVKTGSDIARFAWLAAIRQMEANYPTQLYTLISPQDVFVDYALSVLSYETRPDRGSNMLYLTLVFTQVPIITPAVGAYLNTLVPAAGPVQQIGQIFTNAADAATTALINAKSFIGL
ncbi:hypothetical protein PQ43W_7 [Ralstonia phage PQ43W]